MHSKKVVISVDGASRGNPGPSAIGAVIWDESGEIVTTISRSIGHTTNNQAEYQAVITALETALKLGASQVEVRADSELVVKQLQGRYRVKSSSLRPLYLKAMQLTRQFQSYIITHIPREANRQADKLANQALG